MTIRMLVLMLLCSLTTTVMAADTALINLEEAAEVVDIRILLTDSTSGQIYGRLCDECELMTLRVDSQTQVRQGRKVLSLSQAAALKGGATVLFDPATRRVTRVLFWN